MRISIIGASGFIGSQILEEALRRGHTVTAIARDADAMPRRDGVTAVSGDTSGPAEMAKRLAGNDVVIVAVPWTNNDVRDLLSSIRTAGSPRAIFVVGAGSLRKPDGRLWLEHMIDQGIAPPTSRKALAALETLRGVNDIDWVAVSPSADIEPGERTGKFRLGGDDLLSDKNGESRISTQDFAMAILNEVERPTITQRRFTVGY